MTKTRSNSNPVSHAAVALAAIALLAAMAGCAADRPRLAVPEELANAAQIPGMGEVRGWGEGSSPVIERSIVWTWAQRKASGLPMTEINVLTLSGGGPGGAYGAGILCGWTAAGNRPVFDVVTGISTGALIAPFAFLGPDYDKPLREFYTGVSTKDILHQRPLVEILSGDAATDSAPLAHLLHTGVTAGMLQAVAREHAKGRRLFLGTVNLDAQRPIIWDMGAIASSGAPGAGDLFRQVMLASASIPAAFPPQYIDVEAAGKPYQEMHVDGGIMTQVFHFGQRLDYEKQRAEVKDLPPRVARHVYVIRNGPVCPDYEAVKGRLIPIAGRAVATLLKANGVGDLNRIYALCKLEGMDFHLAYVPDDYHSKAKEVFDTVEMTRLFDLGFAKAKAGTAWSDAPPGAGAPFRAASGPR